MGDNSPDYGSRLPDDYGGEAATRSSRMNLRAVAICWKLRDARGPDSGASASVARLAQWKITSFTRKGSQVQVLQRAPFLI